MDPILVSFEYTEAEAVKATIENLRVTMRGWRFRPWLGAFMVTISALGALRSPSMFPGVLVPFSIGLMMLSFPQLMAFAAKRGFKKHPHAGKLIRWEIAADQLRTKTPDSETVFSWKMLREVCETKAAFLLFPQPYVAHWIPKHAFQSEDDIAKMRGLIEQSGVKFRP